MVYNYRYNSLGASVVSKHNIKCIDTYWITELMLSEMKICGIEQSNKTLDLFLGQIVLNYRRTRNTNQKIKKAIFIKSARLLEEYFLNHIPTTHLSKLYDALKRNDYRRYYMLCSLL